MPKILASEASGLALNVLAALTFRKAWDAEGVVVNCTYPSDGDGWIFDPVNNPSQAEEIILKEAIAWRRLSSGVWQAISSNDLGDAPGAQWLNFAIVPVINDWPKSRKQLFEGQTPFIAAIRCAIAYEHKGDEVQVPLALASRLIAALNDATAEIPASLQDSMPGHCLTQLCEETETEPEEWAVMEGPETGVGIEAWFRHKDGREAYVCDDQGEIGIEVNTPGERESSLGG